MTWTQIPHAVLGRRRLTPMAKLLLSQVAFKLNGGKGTDLRTRQLAADLGTDAKAVIRAKAELVAAGLLGVVPGGGPVPDTYRVITSAGESPAQAKDQRCLFADASGGESPTLAGANRQRCKKEDLQEQRKRRATGQSSKASEATGVPGFRELTTYFSDAWKAKHGGGKYPFAKAKDAAATKRVLDAVDGDLTKAKLVVDAYLADASDWNVEHGHTLSHLSTCLAKCVARLNGAINGNGHKGRVGSPSGKYAGVGLRITTTPGH